MRFSTLPLVFFLVDLSLSQDGASLGNVLQATTTLATQSATASSSPQVVATIQIQIYGLSGSGVISFNNAPTVSDSQRLDSFSPFTPTLTSDGPRQTDSFPSLCNATSWFNTTTTPPGLVNSTLNFGSTVETSAPQQTDGFPGLCNATSLFNTTTIPPRFVNSTLSFNTTVEPSARGPFATPTPTALSIFTGSGALSKRSFLDISALLSTVIIQIAVVFFI
ncbi:MAG: hypothetical protein M1840_000638 [Geoglossum simile]|nr:MAG: hypothetical protein M1840_000638 [Geoglossum simile]